MKQMLTALSIQKPATYFPHPNDVVKFYGDPTAHNTAWQRENLVMCEPPFAMHFGRFPIKRFMCHKHVKQSLDIVLLALWDECGKDQGKIDAGHISNFSGCYNFRNTRGSSSLSMHAFGAAIDFDAENNAMYHGAGEQGFFKRDSAIVQIFKSKGWFWGGEFAFRKDPMHFEAVRR
jgi:D-alanyl-D-alanine carboxypeptidase